MMEITLTHHGILGQKWGVRRYQNEDGTLTSAGKKHAAEGGEKSGGFISSLKKKSEEKKKAKALENRLLNRSTDFAFEFDKTPEGKELLRKYNSEIRKMEKSDDENYDFTSFYKAERDYLYNSGKYQANKLLNDMGKEDFQTALNSLDRKRAEYTTKELIEAWAEREAEVHTY